MTNLPQLKAQMDKNALASEDPELGVGRRAPKQQRQDREQERKQERDRDQEPSDGSKRESDASSPERTGTGEQLAPSLPARRRRPGNRDRNRGQLSRSFSGGVDLMALTREELAPEAPTRRGSLSRSFSVGVDLMAIPQVDKDDLMAIPQSELFAMINPQQESPEQPKTRPNRRPRSKSFEVGVDLMAMPQEEEKENGAEVAATTDPREETKEEPRSAATDTAAPAQPKTPPRRRPGNRNRINRLGSFTRSVSHNKEEKSSDTESDDSPKAKAKAKAPPKRRPNRRASLTKSLTNSFTQKISGLHFSPGAILGHHHHHSSATPDRKAVAVRFSADEAEVYVVEFDWNHTDDVFYTPSEMREMSQSRFDDAAAIRRKRLEGERRRGSVTLECLEHRAEVMDRAGVSALLTKALLDEDRDEGTSIQGIEHMVYPDLQRAMIQRKKELREEVLTFAKSKRPDPQGWRLARHSRERSKWAQDVARKKGRMYLMKNAAGDDYYEDGLGEFVGAGDIDLPTDEEWERIERMSSVPPIALSRSWAG